MAQRRLPSGPKAPSGADARSGRSSSKGGHSHGAPPAPPAHHMGHAVAAVHHQACEGALGVKREHSLDLRSGTGEGRMSGSTHGQQGGQTASSAASQAMHPPRARQAGS
jgi:hypothetical protein